jgi:hypothetical protein
MDITIVDGRLTTGSELLDGAFWVSKLANAKYCIYQFESYYFKLKRNGKLYCCNGTYGVIDTSICLRLSTEEAEDLILKCIAGTTMFRSEDIMGMKVYFSVTFLSIFNFLGPNRMSIKKNYTNEELDQIFADIRDRAAAIRLQIGNTTYSMDDTYTLFSSFDGDKKIKIMNDRELAIAVRVNAKQFPRIIYWLEKFVLTGKLSKHLIRKPIKSARSITN